MLKYPEKYRVAGAEGFPGAFSLQFKGRDLYIITSNMLSWDHVSVSLKNRCPNWPEMCFVKEMFWDDSDWVIQFHPPKEDNINIYEYCLHLWRPQNEEIPMPMIEMV